MNSCRKSSLSSKAIKSLSPRSPPSKKRSYSRKPSKGPTLVVATPPSTRARWAPQWTSVRWAFEICAVKTRQRSTIWETKSKRRRKKFKCSGTSLKNSIVCVGQTSIWASSKNWFYAAIQLQRTIHRRTVWRKLLRWISPLQATPMAHADIDLLA